MWAPSRVPARLLPVHFTRFASYLQTFAKLCRSSDSDAVSVRDFAMLMLERGDKVPCSAVFSCLRASDSWSCSFPVGCGLCYVNAAVCHQENRTWGCPAWYVLLVQVAAMHLVVDSIHARYRGSHSCVDQECVATQHFRAVNRKPARCCCWCVPCLVLFVPLFRGEETMILLHYCNTRVDGESFRSAYPA
jgi:hypothetical protein